MIRRYIIHIVWIVIVVLLIWYSLNYKGGEDAMLAQVESNATAISFRKPVLVKKIYVSPGQVVDSGNLLLEVERPGMDLDLLQQSTKKDQLIKTLTETDLNYNNSIKVLESEKELESALLAGEKERLIYELNQVKSNTNYIDSLGNLSFKIDTEILEKKLSLITDQLRIIESDFQLKLTKLKNTYTSRRFQISSDIEIATKEIEAINLEMCNFQKRAEKSCTIGNVYVELDELVPPYTTLMSLYDLTPTQIKAYVAEGSVENLDIGTVVMVRSINREYEVEGKIVEIGSRVTAYPDKINPALNMKFYGQEIFINIPKNNSFLNGEKVYVYVIEN